MSDRARILLNFGLFQLGWFACVLGAGGTIPAWSGPLCAALILSIHLTTMPGGRRVEELFAIALITLGGVALDALNVATGSLAYGVGGIAWLGVPLWVVALWAIFASMFDAALRWLQRRPILTAVCAGIGSPLSYLAGERFGAVAIGEPRTWSLMALGASWALFVTISLTLRGIVAAARQPIGTHPRAADSR